MPEYRHSPQKILKNEKYDVFRQFIDPIKPYSGRGSRDNSASTAS